MVYTEGHTRRKRSRTPGRPAGREKDDFIYTTDLSLTAEQVVGGFSGRWSIEDTIKNTKQLVGGKEPQTRKGRGLEHAAAISFCLFSIIWLWYLQRKTKHRTFVIQPWYLGKLEPSFTDALSCLRGVLWRERIKIMFGKSSVHDKKFEFLIESLAAST